MSSCSRTCAPRAERCAAALAIALVLGGCAAARGLGRQPDPQEELRRETRQLVETFGRARLECEQVDGVYVQAMPADRPAPGAPPAAAREHWTVTGCERRAVFEVSFIPEPQGGTGVDVQPWGEVRDASCPSKAGISSAPSGTLAERVARAGRRCP